MDEDGGTRNKMAASSSVGPSLGELFDQGWKDYQYMETTDDSAAGGSYQTRAKTSLEKSELGIVMVNQLDLFSTNEDFDEITTNEVRFMIMPALAGYFAYKVNDRIKRLEMLEKSKEHYVNFLKLCKNYGLTNASIPGEKGPINVEPGSQEEIVQMADQRKLKIERFKKQKEEEKKLKELFEKVKAEHVDDEIKRDYYTTLVQKFIYTSLEDLDAINMEIPMVKRMTELGGPGNAPPAEPKPKKNFGTPFILTKNDLQKQVFGMGYTNLPTYSVEEFYENQVQAGKLPGPGTVMPPANPTPEEVTQHEDQEEIEKEQKIENDDEETLQKQRNWDEWKDDHRRGWGNRQNMG